ncbi:DNA repair protein RadC [Reichenbachiella agarivorans]|uniref:DNA repair protein RadC n=1 Tax=Reichenbachiella agarivorans TaxID=2979464 RepID=A0ABY6CZW0_9BACT|nr:DNA repair protein RadC [Reichenbachiella agarivorans]UXP33780.1 DNA repair protein RadC [Reichenbachiella agarivorans]
MQYSSNLTIKKWAEEDRPREKLILKGKASLSEAELIAILIGSGTKSLTAVQVAQNILSSTHNNLNELAKLSLNDLKKFSGIGEAKAISIISALELGRRRKESEPERKPKITGSDDVFALMKAHLLDLNHEEFWAVYLNRGNFVIHKEQISSGGVSGTVVDSKLLFKKALEVLASSVILVHNHPSGNLNPSQEDITLTKKLQEAGRVLEIPVLDHVIFTDHAYFSFADESMM